MSFLKICRRGAWDPYAIPRSVLRAWWSAYDHGTALMTDDGSGLISSWKDRINAINLTATTTARPTWSATAFNSAYPGLTFNGTANCLVNSAFGSFLPVAAVPGWILMAVQPENNGASGILFRYGGQTNGTFRGCQKNAAGSLVIQDGLTSLTDVSTQWTTSFFGPLLVLLVFNTTAEGGYTFESVTSPATATIATLNTGTTMMRLGATNSASPLSFFKGVITDVLIGSGVPTLAERQQWMGFCASRMRLASRLDLTNPWATLTPFGAGVTDLWGILGTGQSNSNGDFSDTVVDSTALDPGRASSFNGAIRTLGTNMGYADKDTVLSDANIQTLIDLQEKDHGVAAQTIGSRMTHRLVAGLASTYGVNFSVHGCGGVSYDEFKQGTTIYSNMLKATDRLVTIARATGLSVRVPYIAMIAGETDHADSETTYLGKMVEYQTNIDTDIRARTGQSQPVVVMLDQEARYIGATSRLGQLKAALDYPTKFIMVGPKYHLAVGSDGVHMTAISTARRGAEFGRAARTVFADAGTYTPLYVTSAVRTGASVVLTFAGNTGTLAFDTTLVTAVTDGNKGIQWVQTGGTTRTISSVAITATNQITVTLSGNPGSPTTQQIKIAQNGDSDDAGPTVGSRSNIRDSDTDTEVVSGTTYPLYKWACHQVIDVV